MSVSAVPQSAAPQAAWQANADQFKQSFQSLGSALQSGDLSSAQQAFAALQQLQPANASNKANLSSGPLSNDWNALSQALQSGDTKAAQTAFTQLQTDMQAMRKGHHHHHAGGSSQAQSSPSPGGDGASTAAISTGPGVLA